MITNQIIAKAQSGTRGSQKAKVLIIQSYQSMIINISKKMCIKYNLWGIDDLMSVGNITILKAIKNYKLEKRFSFDKYLRSALKRNLEREVFKTYRNVRRPEALCYKETIGPDKNLDTTEIGNWYSV